MSEWSVLAAKASSIASDVSAGIAHAIGTGAADGFAVGTALTAVSFMLVISRRRARLARSAGGAPSDVVALVPLQPDEPGIGETTGEMLVVTAEPRPDSESLVSQPKEGRSGKHRSASSDAVVLRWPDAKRTAPRHAAPSASTKLVSVVTLRPVAAQS